MGKRYYCDYCDRSFKDDVEARKKHISSLQHAKNRADHYNYFKDPEVILREESVKMPCKRFMLVGDCAFGFGCRFSHYTPNQIYELQQLVAMRYEFKRRVTPSSNWPHPDGTIKEYSTNIENSDTAEEIKYPSWNVPLELQNYPNLPPSLWPITAKSITGCQFNKWG